MKAYKKNITNVTPDNLNILLRIAGISLDNKTIDKITDLIYLLEDKGTNASIRDVCKLKNKWNQTK